MALVTQINAQHSRKSTIEIAKLFQNKPNQVILITEPYIYKSKIPYIDRHVVNTITPEPKARTAILHSRSLNICPAPNYSNRDTTTCLWEVSENKTIYLASAYWDINCREPPSKLQKLIDEQRNVIIGIDTNAHSTLWGSPENNSRGDLLEDTIVTKNLTLLNTGGEPTFIGRNTKTHTLM